MNNRYLRYPVEIRQQFAATNLDAARLSLADVMQTPANLIDIYTDLQDAALALDNIESDNKAFLTVFTAYIQYLSVQHGVQLPNTTLASKEALLAHLNTELTEAEKNQTPDKSLEELNDQITKGEAINARTLYLAMHTQLKANELSDTYAKLLAELQTANATQYLGIVSNIQTMVQQFPNHPSVTTLHNKIHEDLCQFFTKEKLDQLEFGIYLPLMVSLIYFLNKLTPNQPASGMFVKLANNECFDARCATILQSNNFDALTNTEQALHTLPDIVGKAPYFTAFKIQLRLALLNQYQARVSEATHALNRQSLTFNDDVKETRDFIEKYRQANLSLLELRFGAEPQNKTAAINVYLTHLRAYSQLLQEAHQYDDNYEQYSTAVRPIRKALLTSINHLRTLLVANPNEETIIKQLAVYYFTLITFYRDAACLAKTRDMADDLLDAGLEYADCYLETVKDIKNDLIVEAQTAIIKRFQEETFLISDVRQLKKAVTDRQDAINKNDYQRAIEINYRMIAALSEMDVKDSQAVTPITISQLYKNIGDHCIILEENQKAIQAYKSAIHHNGLEHDAYNMLITTIDNELARHPLSLQAAYLKHDRAIYANKLARLNTHNASTATVVSTHSATVFGAPRSNSAPDLIGDETELTGAQLLSAMKTKTTTTAPVIITSLRKRPLVADKAASNGTGKRNRSTPKMRNS